MGLDSCLHVVAMTLSDQAAPGRCVVKHLVFALEATAEDGLFQKIIPHLYKWQLIIDKSLPWTCSVSLKYGGRCSALHNTGESHKTRHSLFCPAKVGFVFAIPPPDRLPLWAAHQDWHRRNRVPGQPKLPKQAKRRRHKPVRGLQRQRLAAERPPGKKINVDLEARRARRSKQGKGKRRKNGTNLTPHFHRHSN